MPLAPRPSRRARARPPPPGPRWPPTPSLDDAAPSNNIPAPQGRLRALDSALSDNGRFFEFSDNTVFNSFQLAWRDDFEARHHQPAAKSFTELGAPSPRGRGD